MLWVCVWPATAVAPSCCSHTGPPAPSSGSRACAAGGASHPSAACPPVERTERQRHRQATWSKKKCMQVQFQVYLFDLLPVLWRAASGVYAEALLKHGHAGLGLATLDLWHSVLLLLLPDFNNLNHPLVVALHLLLLLKPHEKQKQSVSRFLHQRLYWVASTLAVSICTFSCFLRSWCLWRKYWSFICCFISWCLSWRFFSSISQMVASRSDLAKKHTTRIKLMTSGIWQYYPFKYTVWRGWHREWPTLSETNADCGSEWDYHWSLLCNWLG